MIPFIRPYYDESDFEAVKRVLKSGWVAQGPKVEEFEEAVADYLDCKYVISVTNCTTALTLALMALGIGKGDEVIVPDFTFPATALAVTNVGAIPILADVSMYTQNIDDHGIVELITKKTKAIIPVHLFGLAASMKSIKMIANECELYIIEDAACALGTEVPYLGRMEKAGTVGDIGCFSLHASKGITTGEGGLVCTDNEDYANRIRRLAVFGDERAYRRSKTKAPFYFDPAANNFKMSDITAAIGLAQLKKIEMLIDWRIKIAMEWDEIIANDDYLNDVIRIKPRIVKDHTNIYQSYVAVCRDNERQKVMDYFAEKGFATGIGTHACHRYPNLFRGKLPVFCEASDYLFRNAISLPRYYGLEVKKEWEKSK